MEWYQLLTAIEEQPPLINLCTGSPLLVEGMTKVLSRALQETGELDGIETELGQYANLDGLPELIATFADGCSKYFGRRINHQQILIVPGVQAALRYVHEILRSRGRSERVLFPIGLEFPGATDVIFPTPPHVGEYHFERTHGNLFQPLIAHSSLNWEGVGAVILSRPHNPTGCLWSTAEIHLLAEKAAEHGAWIVIDETYALPFGPMTADPYSVVDGPNVIHLYSFSKIGLAGERVGVVLGPEEIVCLFRAALRRNLIQAPKVGQRLALSAIEALRSDPALASCFGKLYQQRWEYCTRLLSAVDSEVGIGISQWQGGPFLWCHWSGKPSGDQVFRELLREGVAVAPGSALWINPASSAPRPEGIRLGLGAPFSDLGVAASAIARVLSRMLQDAKSP